MSNQQNDRKDRLQPQNHEGPFTMRSHYCEGPNFTLVDKKLLCAFARLCHTFGGVWNHQRHPVSTTKADPIRDVSNTTANRVLIIDNQTGRIIEDVDDVF